MDGELTAPWCVILNPLAGSGQARHRWRQVEDALQVARVRHEVTATRAAGEARQLVAAAFAAGVRHFLAVGGDGTVNEVLNGLEPGLHPDVPTPPVLAVLPAGTGNDWARTLDLPGDAAGLADCLRRASWLTSASSVRRLDVGELAFPDGTVHLFAEEAGAGFDAHVLRHLQRRGPRRFAYLRALLSSLGTYAPPRLRLVVDGEEAQAIELEEAFMALAGNGRWTGGGMRLTPDACPMDGRLDFVAIRSLATLALLGKIPKLFDGRLPKDPAVVSRRGTSATLTLEPPGEVQADGQIVGLTPVRFNVRQGVLAVPMPQSD